MTSWITKENLNMTSVIEMLNDWGFEKSPSYKNELFLFEKNKMCFWVSKTSILISNGTKYSFQVPYTLIDHLFIGYRKGKNRDVNVYVNLIGCNSSNHFASC